MAEKNGVSFNKFVAGILLAILIASAVSIGFNQLSPGPAGPKGDKGDTGDAGVAGLAGPKGDAGDRGATGATGSTGTTGAAGASGATGPAGLGVTPGSLVTPAYDSGWINITNMVGQNIIVNHNLNSADVTVEILGRTTATGGIHQKNLGLTSYSSGWSKVYGFSSGGEVPDGNIFQTNDGGYIIAGRTTSVGAGSGDAWLVKANAFGNIEWNKTYGGSLDDRANDMCKTSDGGYALAGLTNSFGAGIADYWLIRVNATGEMLWNKTYGGIGEEQVNWVIQTRDGGFAMAGRTNSTGAGSSDIWLVKTNANGDMVWNMTYGGAAAEFGMEVIQTSDGGYVVVGYTSSFGAGGSDVWLIKTDASGNPVWNKTYGGTGTEQAYTIVQTTDGGFAITGLTTTWGAGGNDAWLVKTDTSGNALWNKTYGGNATEYGIHGSQSTDGGYVICGTTTTFGAGGYDAWLVKTDDGGNMLWNKTFGGSRTEIAWSMSETKDGGFIIGAATHSYGFGTSAAADMFLIKTDVEQGLTQVNSTPNSVTLYRGVSDAYWNYVRVRVWKTT